MSNTIKQTLDELMKIEGALGACVVDFKSGLALGAVGGGPQLNIEVAAAGNSEVMRAKMKVMGQLGLKDRIEDMLITLNSQYHIIRPLTNHPNLFIYMALSRANANLALARYKIQELETAMTV